jgi:hypothetical protein
MIKDTAGKTLIKLSLGLLCTVIIPCSLLAQGVIATVSDSAGNQVKLTGLTTKEITLHVGDTTVHIAPETIKEITAVSGGLEVVLASGTTLKGTSDGQIAGQWELGSYTLALSKCRRIVFERGSGMPPTDWVQPPGYMATVNETEVFGLQYEFTWSGCDPLWIPCKSYSRQKTLLFLPVLKGDLLFRVPFSAIAQASPSGVELRDGSRIEGRFTSMIGTLNENRRFEGSNRKLIGQTKYGKIEFPINKIKSIVFHPESSLPLPESDLMKLGAPASGARESIGEQATIVTAGGESVLVSRLDFFAVDTKGFDYIPSRTMEVRIGESINQIEIAKLSAVKDFSVQMTQYGGILSLNARISTKSGNTLAVQFVIPDICFGGQTAQGYVKACSSDLKSVDIK